MRPLALLRSPACLLILWGVLLMLPAFLWGPGATHSHHYNILWTRHFADQMAAGHLYERWLPDSFERLGSPTFYFYPPFAYWISGGFRALGLPLLQAINLAGLTLLVGSGLAMHRWLTWRGTQPLLGAALYMIAPYHLYDIYVRGALAEAAAFVWLPLIALAIERLPERRGMRLLAVAYAGLLISHLPLAMLTGLFLIAPMIALRLWRDARILAPAALAGALAFALAAFYLLPALTLQSHVSTMMLWGQDYRATDWSVWTASFELFPCLAMGLILLAWPAARSFWGVAAILTAMASIRLIPFLWDVPMLDKAQFPWRALCLAEFATVTAMMAVRPRPVLLAGAGILLLFPYAFGGLLTAAFLRKPIDYAAIARIAPDAPEYLPRGFDLSHVRAGDHWTDLSPWRALPRGDAILVSRPGPVMIGRAAFPIWRIELDGRVIPSAGPILHFDARRPGTYRIVRIRLWQEMAGMMISLATMLLTMLHWRFRAISHLSKFPAYSPSSPISDRLRSDWPARSHIAGGDL
ncbi:integral membrane-like protein [Sphingobium sp. HBC34]|uniref:Integral membrane-like protein n=1 Tax=Sphingobium cyanobacteriorum TaxID=3063954 RepID=A0ABT8ZHE4_9SPHN|nr:integral membrane-like protein [Sphingobium sp. HBC34]MDO7833953.1 integral membrane-like protein [Sphingobium sp. HBC34]